MTLLWPRRMSCHASRTSNSPSRRCSRRHSSVSYSLLQNISTPLKASTGLGRRIGSRSGQFDTVASRFGPRKHQIVRQQSSLGLSTVRKEHEKHLTSSNSKGLWDRPDGLHSQLRPKGLVSLTQFEATSPYAILSKSKSLHNIKQPIDSDARKEIGQQIVPLKFKRELHVDQRPPTVIPKGLELPAKEERSLQTRSQQRKEDEASIDTTSTMRRESVNDLYKAYGLETPLDLLSSEHGVHASNGGFLTQPQIAKKHRFCHRCTWVNGLERRCWRCGHVMCQLCDGLGVDSGGNSEKQSPYSTKTPKPPLTLDESRSHGAQTITKSREGRSMSPEQWKYKSDAHSRQCHHHRGHSSSVNDYYLENDRQECSSPSCRATHTGHQPYRHSISCTTKRGNCADSTRGNIGEPHQNHHDRVTSHPHDAHLMAQDEALHLHIDYHVPQSTDHSVHGSQISPHSVHHQPKELYDSNGEAPHVTGHHIARDTHTSLERQTHRSSQSTSSDATDYDAGAHPADEQTLRTTEASQDQLMMPIPRKNIADLPWMVDNLIKETEIVNDDSIQHAKSRPSLGTLNKMSIQGLFSRPKESLTRWDSEPNSNPNTTPRTIAAKRFSLRTSSSSQRLSAIFATKKRVRPVGEHSENSQNLRGFEPVQEDGSQTQVKRATSMMIMGTRKGKEEARTHSRTDAGVDDLEDTGIDSVSLVIHLKGKPDVVLEAALGP